MISSGVFISRSIDGVAKNPMIPSRIPICEVFHMGCFLDPLAASALSHR